MKKIKLLTTLGALPVVGGGVALAATSCSNTSIVIPIPAPTPAPGYETLTVDECKGLAMGFMDAHAARSTARQPEAGTKITKRLEQLKAQIGAVNTISQVVALSSIMAPQWYTTGQVGPFDTGYTTGYEGLAESIAVQPEIDEPGDPADP